MEAVFVVGIVGIVATVAIFFGSHFTMEVDLPANGNFRVKVKPRAK
jgi:hypothetical protein